MVLSSRKKLRKHFSMFIFSLILTSIGSLTWKNVTISSFISSVVLVYTMWFFIDLILVIFYNPKHNFKTSYLNFIILFIISCVFTIIVYFILTYATGYIVLGSYSFSKAYKDSINHVFTKNLEFIVILPFFIFIFERWKKSSLNEEKMKSEALKYQYETLKNQVNPHFLFNNLNSLSSLMHKDLKQADEFIKIFSEIYRYVLAQRNIDFVPLKSEIEFIKSYFYLQNLRDSEKVQLDINIANYNFQIIPVSLQILVENAIKHNAATREEPLLISIELVDNKWIYVKNNLQMKPVMGGSEKVGLENLKSRYLILAKKEVIIEKTVNEFLVKIPLIPSKDESTNI